MHVIRHFIPWNDKSCSVRTENRIRRVRKIPLRIITGLCDHLFRVVTWVISRKPERYFSKPFRVGSHFLLVICHARHRSNAAQNLCFALLIRTFKLSMHLFNIRHSTSYHILRNSYVKFIIRLQQHRLRLF